MIRAATFRFKKAIFSIDMGFPYTFAIHDFSSGLKGRRLRGVPSLLLLVLFFAGDEEV